MSELEYRTVDEMRELEAKAAMADELASVLRMERHYQKLTYGEVRDWIIDGLAKYNAINGGRS